MLDKIFWFFLQFPYNLSIVFLIFWLCRETAKQVLSLQILAISVLFAAFWMEGIPSVFFWLPSGASTVIVVAVFTLFYLSVYSKKNQITLEIPNNVSWDRDILKRELTGVDKYDDRQRIYLDFVKKMNSFLGNVNQKMGSRVNYYFIMSLALLFCINFGYWVFQYATDNLLIFQLFDKSKIEKLVSDEKMRTSLIEFHKNYRGNLLNYSASLTMVLNTLSLLLILPIIRWMRSKKNEKLFFWLDLCFFRLPESMILIYMPIIALFIVSIFYNVLGEYSYWFANLAFIFSFLYLLNGLAIARAYTKARFLPFAPILLIIFSFSWFMPQLLLLLVLSLFIVGLLDFAFDIKKKALHHVSVRIEE